MTRFSRKIAASATLLISVVGCGTAFGGVRHDLRAMGHAMGHGARAMGHDIGAGARHATARAHRVAHRTRHGMHMAGVHVHNKMHHAKHKVKEFFR